MSSSDLAGYAQQDAHEFFISALNQIHAKSPSNSSLLVVLIWIQFTAPAMCGSDADVFFLLPCALASKLHHCSCVIHKTFAGVLQSDVTCLNCANVTSAFDPILDISLDLRPTKRSKSMSKVRGLNDERNDGPNSLADCLDR